MLRKDLKILAFSSLIYIIILGSLSLIKYYNLLYNQLDLAIFTNILFNLKENFSLYSSIQGHSYLGDHVAPIILLLIPLFTIAPHAITLLFFQTIVLAGTSFVIYKLVETYLNTHNTGSLKTELKIRLPLWFGLVWLINPLSWNANLFEFHLLIFVPILIFLSFIFYWQNKFNYFVLSLISSCVIREDVALIVLMIGIIAWIEKKPWKYIIIPITIGLIYFIFALYLLGQNADGNFRFIIYYSWLGSSIPEIIKNIIFKPQLWLRHIGSISNLDMLIGFLFPFLFLPLRKPKYLLINLLSLAQFLLGGSRGSNIVVENHYSLLFIPGLVLSSLDGLVSILKNKASRIYKFIIFDKQLTKIVLAIFFILTLALMGPPYHLKIKSKFIKINKDKNIIIKNIAATIPKNDSIVTSYNILANLSNRTDISPLHYIFLGYQQFSIKPYLIKQEPNYVLMDLSDLNTFDAKSRKNQEDYPVNFHQGITNLQNFLINYTPTFYPENVIFWTKNNKITNPTQTPFVITDFPQPEKNINCNQTETQTEFVLACSLIEPRDQVYWIAANKKPIPFFWRDYNQSNNFQNAYFKIIFKKNSQQQIINLQAIVLKDKDNIYLLGDEIDDVVDKQIIDTTSIQLGY